MALSPRPRRARAREGWPLSHRRSIATSRSPASRDVAHARRRTRTRSHKCDRAHLPSTSHDGTRAVALTAPAPDARGEALALDSTPTSRAFVDAQTPARRLARRRSMRTNTFAFVTADVVAFVRPSPRRSRARVVARSRRDARASSCVRFFAYLAGGSEVLRQSDDELLRGDVLDRSRGVLGGHLSLVRGSKRRIARVEHRTHHNRSLGFSRPIPSGRRARIETREPSLSSAQRSLASVERWRSLPTTPRTTNRTRTTATVRTTRDKGAVARTRDDAREGDFGETSTTRDGAARASSAIDGERNERLKCLTSIDGGRTGKRREGRRERRTNRTPQDPEPNPPKPRRERLTELILRASGIKKPKRVGKPSTKGVRIALLRRSRITVRNALASTRPAQPIADHLRLFRLADGSEVPQEPKVRQER